MKQRPSRFWFKNEKKVLKKLGLNPVPGSGSGELYKEDGENDYILCQLKSTEQASYRISKLDVEKLIYHADLLNKVPVFVIQFMDGPMLIATIPSELGNIASYLNDGLFTKTQVEIHEIPKQRKMKKVRSEGMDLDTVREIAKDDIEEQEEVSTDFLNNAFSIRKERDKNKLKRRY